MKGLTENTNKMQYHVTSHEVRKTIIKTLFLSQVWLVHACKSSTQEAEAERW
jgi:hypothetical protein